jgi:uncharacterized membrane protein YgdD (TMEM256/DUF423 family)
MDSAKWLALLGALSAAAAVAAGALGAHALRGRLSPESLNLFETAARYQMYHALGLLVAAWGAGRLAIPAATWAGWCFVVGTLLFSGSLYLLALTGARWWGAVTPLGGVCFIVGWCLLAWGMWNAR